MPVHSVQRRGDVREGRADTVRPGSDAHRQHLAELLDRLVVLADQGERARDEQPRLRDDEVVRIGRSQDIREVLAIGVERIGAGPRASNARPTFSSAIANWM